jgi:hypothetical protein
MKLLRLHIFIYVTYIIPKVHVLIYSENVVGKYGNVD